MTGSGFSDAERAAIYRAIFERRDVRNYRPDPLPEPTLLRILEAAHHAPSVGFMQPWNFVILRDRALRQQIYAHFAEVNGRAAEVWSDERKRAYQSLKLQGILDAPLNLLVTCDHERAGEQVLGRFTTRETDVYSTCLAVQNLWLAARAEGVGVGWMSIMEPAVIAGLLGLPSHVTPVAYLTIGYPVEFADKPLLSQVGWQDRLPLAELVYEDRWGNAPSRPLPTTAQAGAPLRADVVERHPLAPVPEIPEAAHARNRELTKPAHSLGQLEALALRLCALQQTAYPSCGRVALALFAADHGVTAERVSAFKASTTLKLVYGYLAGAGVVNALARQQQVELHVVDVGVNHDFGDARGLIDRKVRRGTRNLAIEAAMTVDECRQAIEAGRQSVAELPDLRLLALGEVGIGNSTSAAALTAALLSLPADEVAGRGTGVDQRGLARKRAVIARALALHAQVESDPLELLRRLGGYEIAALVGAIEAAAERRCLVLLDGMITCVAALVAVRRTPALAPYLVASHLGPEPAHRALLRELGLRPLLELELCLGEGSGAVLAVGLVRAACAVMHEVRTYEEANIERPELPTD
ncbi:MAG: putative nicotinate-nucleotide-dimethylbenzimidazole phosphoribosyltransferase [Myxococcaceae bacterium]|nr:putative nicotinate-nucleotide-dimethylbenzimidazole phosphoribosyltransferase [Myxococcaceae bacterium]